jgi:hypothetical protein
MAEDARRIVDCDLAVEQVQVCAADAAGIDAEQELAGSWLGNWELVRA